MTTIVSPIPLTERLKAIPGFFGIRLEEEARFYVIKKEREIQIRKYYPYLLAQTFIQGNYEFASIEGFFRLANYIFGLNTEKEVMSMTNPIFQGRSKKLTMASPVLHEQKMDGWTMSFVIPAKYKKENVPQPLYKNIEIASVPALVVASIRYKGVNSEDKIKLKSKELISWIQSREDLEIISEPRCAQYDAPHVLPFFRRNEIQITVKELIRKKIRPA